MLDESVLLGSENFEENMKWVVEPFLEKYEESGFLKTDKGVKIHFHKYTQKEALGNIVISHGFCEFAKKFEEMVYYLVKEGYNVYVPEHEGHGYSERKVSNDEMVYVDKFDDYADDMHEFVTKIVPERNRFLIAHSMGGAIGIRVLEKYPADFEKAVLSSPMCGMKTGKYPKGLSLFIAQLMCLFGKKKEFAIGQKGFREPTFETSSCLNKPRYMYLYNMRVENTNYRTYGGSFGWVKESLKIEKKLLKKSNIKKITADVLIFQAGLDHLVDLNEQNKFLQSCKNARMIQMKDAKHEIFNCNDNHRRMFYKEAIAFLQQ